MLDNLRIFITAAEQGSLTETAKILSMTIATVSRRVTELERALGVELFHRTNKGLTLTSSGNEYYRECANSVNDLNQRLISLDASINDIEGPLRVVVPVNIGSGPLNEFWQIFSSKHPQIALSISLIDANESVMSKQPDIALCSGQQENSSLIQNGLGNITPILVAGPTQKGNLPKTPQELTHINTIAGDIFTDWTLENLDDKSKYNVLKTHTHYCNDMSVSLNLARAGAGIALLPMSLVHDAIERGELLHVLPDWHGPARKISLVWPYQKTISVRAKVFRKTLIDFLDEQPWFESI